MCNVKCLFCVVCSGKYMVFSLWCVVCSGKCMVFSLWCAVCEVCIREVMLPSNRISGSGQLKHIWTGLWASSKNYLTLYTGTVYSILFMIVIVQCC